MRAESWVMVSSTWLAKNINPVSMIANSSAKNTGATRANSTAADPRRLRRNLRKAFLTVAGEAAGDGIRGSWQRQQRSARNNYLKLIVELFPRIATARTAELTAHQPFPPAPVRRSSSPAASGSDSIGA